GYTFGGWYTTETGGTQFNFSSMVTSDIVLYARWIPATANYTVVFWQQSKLDNKNAGAGQKTYDYVGQINRTGTVESTVYLQQS
ncbi:InlB B-repeat-containing protein, partial [Bacillus cereus group sp. Bce018]|uniref:InlB B-repeat-containing protein n=1 Tax=Bacillus cereus group sp. Bce018 TaxID=3445248 RepID=UPI003F1EE867